MLQNMLVDYIFDTLRHDDLMTQGARYLKVPE